ANRRSEVETGLCEGEGGAVLAPRLSFAGTPKEDYVRRVRTISLTEKFDPVQRDPLTVPRGPTGPTGIGDRVVRSSAAIRRVRRRAGRTGLGGRSRVGTIRRGRREDETVTVLHHDNRTADAVADAHGRAADAALDRLAPAIACV